jgi:hypothetical protein
MSVTVVRPRAPACAAAAASLRSCRSAGGAAMLPATASIALSISTPVGAPRRRAGSGRPAGRRFGGVDPQRKHRAGVEQRRVAVDPGQPHRVVGHRRGERPRGWGSPSPASRSGPSRGPAPRCRRALGGGRGDPGRPPRRSWSVSDQVDLLEGRAEPSEVRVGVDQPGGDGAAAELDTSVVGAAQRRGAVVRTEVDDHPVAHRQAARDRLGRLDRVEHAPHQHEVGGVLAQRVGRCMRRASLVDRTSRFGGTVPAAQFGSASCKGQATERP